MSIAGIAPNPNPNPDTRSPPGPLPAPGSLAELDGRDLADLLLHLVLRGCGAAVLEEGEGESAVSVRIRDSSWFVGSVAVPVGDAAVAHLAGLAGIRLGAPSEFGRFRASAGGQPREVLVAIRASRRGFGLEIWAVGRDDAGGAPGPLSVETIDRSLGAYDVGEMLGQGGMGIVYRGTHRVLRKPVAIKVIAEALAQNPDSLERFLNEARIASRVRHPGIVDVTDFGVLPDGRTFLVMELVEGRTLESLVAEGPLSVARATALGAELATALGAAHAAGVVHRDLKPANVFVVDGDRIKIGDFGVARLIDARGDKAALGPGAEPTPSIIVGTPLYMAPEQALGQVVDIRSDIYSFGCILFEMVSGHPPFLVDTAEAALVAHLTEAPPPLSNPGGPVPVALAAMVTSLLAKDRFDRPARAEDVAQALRSAGSGVAPKSSRWWAR